MGWGKKSVYKRNGVRKSALDKKLAGYSAAAVAALAYGIPAAQAVPVSYTPPGSPISLGWGGSYSIDMDMDNEGDFAFGLFSATYANGNYQVAGAMGLAGIGENQLARIGGGWQPGQWNLVNFVEGGKINGDLPFFRDYGILAYNGAIHDCGKFLGEVGYLGVRFDIDTIAHYGWIKVGVNADASQLDIYSWGYESEAGKESFAGATTPAPEPATLSLLAMGAAGLFAWRGKRKEGRDDQAA